MKLVRCLLKYYSVYSNSLPAFLLAGHMAEETKGASKSAPMGMVYCVVISSAVGLCYILGLLLSTAADVAGYVNNDLEPSDVFFHCSGQVVGVSLMLKKYGQLL